MSWNQSPAFVGNTNFIEHEVCGVTSRYHPVTVKKLFALRVVAQPLAKALVTLFSGPQSEIHRGIEGEGWERIQERPSVEARAEAVAQAIEAVMDDKNGEVFASLIIDSMRDTFPPTDQPPPSVLLESMSPGQLIGHLMGVAKANKDVLGPLGLDAQAVSEGLGVVRSMVKARVAEATEQPQEATAEPAMAG